MNENITNQIAGVLRALIPTAVMIAVASGLIDKDTANQLTPEMLRLVELTFGATGVASVIIAAWSLWSNRPKAVARQTAADPNVIVSVGPGASSGLQSLSKDPAAVNVVPNDSGGLLQMRDPGLESLPMGLVSTPPRSYRVSLPYHLPNWKLNIAMGYIRPHWSKIPIRTANKIAAAYNGRTELVLTKDDFDSLPDDLWRQVSPYL